MNSKAITLINDRLYGGQKLKEVVGCIYMKCAYDFVINSSKRLKASAQHRSYVILCKCIDTDDSWKEKRKWYAKHFFFSTYYSH